jgi:hypothetical protein
LPPVKDIREAVTSLAETALRSVSAVRDAFSSGIPPYQTVGSGSVASYVAAITKDPLASKIVQSTSHLGLATSMAGSSVPAPKPELDSAEVFEDAGGILDAFSVRLTVSIRSIDLSKVKYLKVMRANVGPVPGAPRPAVSALMTNPALSGKNLDAVLAAAKMADKVGVGNRLVTFISTDLADSGKSVSSPNAQELRPVVPPTNTNKRTNTAAGLLSIAGADRSVVENLSFYLNRQALGAVPKPPVLPTEVVSRTGINVLKGNSVAALSSGIVQAPNAMGFSEITRVDAAGPNARTVGDFIESYVIDRAVVYGSSFVYYVSCVGHDGSEGPRSRMVKVNVLRNVPPDTPDVVYSIIGGHPRFTIRCRPGTDHVEIFRSGRAVLDSIRLGSENSLIMQGPATKVGQYWHISDVGLGPDGSTSFVDTSAVPGDRLSYRIYAVDPYGMKSQTPFSCSLKMPEDGRPIPLPVPTITAEQVVGQPAVSVKMRVDDPRVLGFTVQRRDVTIHEKSVHQANQPEHVDLGIPRSPKSSISRQGPQLRDADWPVYVPASQGSASYVDTSVRIDRVYQYAIGAIDNRGNKTLLVGSPPIGVYARPVIDPPTALSSSISVVDGDPVGVVLSWTPSTNDFSPNSLIGDQDVLAATAVRSVFQVERRQVGAPFWDALPATSESWFLDKVSTEQAPPFRPAYVIPGGVYEYRVIAMQSGGLLSSRTDPIFVTVAPPPAVPSPLYVRSTPIEVIPTIVVVSWNMVSTFVERWEVERAVTNRLYGSQISAVDIETVKRFEYRRVADLTPESSRARALTADTGSLDRTIFVGNRFYIDADVTPANAYFYRVRTVGRLGTISDWVYSGVVLRDVAFDRKFFSTLDDEVKVELSTNPREITTRDTAELAEELIRLRITRGIEP